MVHDIYMFFHFRERLMLCLMKCLTNCYLRGSFCSMMLDDDAYFLPTDDVLNCLEEKTNLLDNELNDILCQGYWWHRRKVGLPVASEKGCGRCRKEKI